MILCCKSNYCFFFVLCIFASSLKTQASTTTTPIKHVVVIYQENRTFDNYFATYPFAENNPGETPFTASKNTPSVNGLLSSGLIKNNPNLFRPYRVGPIRSEYIDPNHDYTQLQQSCNKGLMDQFVQASEGTVNPRGAMEYVDGNTVTGIWNYAQFFAINDNFRSTTLGPSVVGAINLISGNAHGAPEDIESYVVEGTIINDIDPLYDKCSEAPLTSLSGINVGNLLNAKGVTWGWFQGGFANCNVMHESPFGPLADYVPRRNPFQFYESTSNPLHLPPSSVDKIGYTDQANHIYDISDFWAALKNGNLPSVCFIKAPQYQTAHPYESSSLLEQEFLVPMINKLQTYKHYWKDMAIIIGYDDSGGLYDHECPVMINDSQLADYDVLTAPGFAGSQFPMGGYQGRPGYGLRLPFLLISPWAKINYVDHTLIDQTSILRFIEDNWSLGRIGDFSFDEFSGSLLNMFDFSKRRLRYLFLNPNTGAIQYRSHS